MWGVSRPPADPHAEQPYGLDRQAGKHFSLPLVLYTQLLNADGELLVIVGHLGLATGDLSAPDGPAVGQRTRQPPEQESTVLR
jgi:hypothetical protein